jgi:hypothetical protein
MKFRFTAAAVAAAAFAILGAVGPADASVADNYDYQTSYDIYYPAPDGSPPITNVMLFQDHPSVSSSSLTWAFTIDPTGDSFQTILNPFKESTPTEFASLIGLLTDADSTQHVVLGLATGTAIATAGEDWDQLFPSTSEDTVLAALQLATSGGPFCGSGPPCIDSGLDALFSFFGNDMQSIPDPATPGNVLDGLFAVPGDFTLVSFSTGVTVGSGATSITATPVPALVPEPASWAMMLVGFASLGAAARAARRRRSALA